MILISIPDFDQIKNIIMDNRITMAYVKINIRGKGKDKSRQIDRQID